MPVELKPLPVLLVFTGLQLSLHCFCSKARFTACTLRTLCIAIKSCQCVSSWLTCMMHVMDEWMACISKYNILHLRCSFNIFLLTCTVVLFNFVNDKFLTRHDKCQQKLDCHGSYGIYIISGVIVMLNTCFVPEHSYCTNIHA